MYCADCNSDLEDCTCPGKRERLATMSDAGGPTASRWCKVCDSHYIICSCKEPEWVLRQGGKLYALPNE
jgi:hypothetical protein